jgi:ubiquinone/menaquinone biosynthesis C-methylase UbiE
MEKEILPQPDKNGIIRALPSELSEVNRQRLKQFGAFVFLFDFAQYYFVRPRIHKADPQRHREILKKLISPVKKSHVLDIACGTGNAIPHFDSSNEYTGLDLSYSMLKQAVKKAKKKMFQKMHFIQGNAEELFFDDESFEFVLMDTSLHMIPKYQLAIAETARVLKKDGVFLCSTPVVGISNDFDTTWKHISDKHGLHSFTEENIKEICSRNGLFYSCYDTNGGVLYLHAQKAK